MRRVSVKYGVKERINEILGTDVPFSYSGSLNLVPDITPWSIQAAMIENTRRVVRGIVGDTDQGRVVRGLSISRSSNNVITIPPGVAFTRAGNIIVLGAPITKSISATSYVYIVHDLNILPGRPPVTNSEAGRKTTLIGTSGVYDIVYDDYAAAAGTTLTNDDITNLIKTYSNLTASDDEVYLGKVTCDINGNISLVTPSYNRGFGPFGSEDMMSLNGVHSRVESKFDGQTTINDTLDITGNANVTQGVLKLGDASSLKAMVGSNEKTGKDIEIQYVKVGDTPGVMKFVKGILVEYS